MKKKMIAVLVVLLVVSTASVFALGIGVQGGTTVGGNPGGYGALSIKPDGSKYIFAVNGNVYSNGLWAEATADRWLANKALAKPVNYFYGVGGAAGVDLWGGNITATAAVRLVAGLNVYVLDDFCEFFLQGAWQPGIKINLGGSGNIIDPLIGVFPINAGFRIWL